MNVWGQIFAVPYGRPRRMPHYFAPVENKIPMRELKSSMSSDKVILQFTVLGRDQKLSGYIRGIRVGGTKSLTEEKMTGQTLFWKKKVTGQKLFWAKNDGARTFL